MDIYGPDQRTQITESTRTVALTVYAPAEIDKQAIVQHLQDMRRDYVKVIAPQTEVVLLKFYGDDQRKDRRR